MSELFDSLNFSNSAGPSSSQTSSQPSGSKVYWHTSPSPGILQQLRSWTPSKEQESPTVPLCTQAFVGELRKFPGAAIAQSPLVGRSTGKRKSTAGRGQSHSNSVTIDDEDDSESEANGHDGPIASGTKSELEPKRLLLGDLGESSPESRRRRTLDAGFTGRLRDASPDSCSADSGPTNSFRPSSLHSATTKRPDRRPLRRRKKESFVAGLGFSEEQMDGTNCVKLFEDLQAAIQNMNSKRSVPVSISNEDKENGNGVDTWPTRLTPREGINRTTSAPTPTRKEQLLDPHGSQEMQSRPALRENVLQTGKAGVNPRRPFTSVKSDHDPFRVNAARATTKAVLPSFSNTQPSASPAIAPVTSQQAAEQEAARKAVLETARVEAPSSDDIQIVAVKAVPTPQRTSVGTGCRTTLYQDAAQTSPLKRSERIEAKRQQSSAGTGKKLGVRATAIVTSTRSSKTASPHKPGSGSPAAASSGLGLNKQRSRSLLPSGLSQARQPGLPRSSSQFPGSQPQSVVGDRIGGTSASNSGLSAPFRPPARNVVNSVNKCTSKITASTDTRRGQQPSSSDDSFPDEDDAFLALACELEY